jgi:16S rRNA (cytidine1402-2'-O)-methyltransferase
MINKILYLIPSSIGIYQADTHITTYVKEALETVDYLIVEHAKPARLFIKQCELKRKIDTFNLIEIGIKGIESQIKNDIETIFKNHQTVGMLSDAGLPCVADPGAKWVNLARKHHFKIVPLVGPSSLMLALMASGLNGQAFCFHGYLPVQQHELKTKLSLMSTQIVKDNSTQLFIETPYRNQKLLESLLQFIPENIRLCIALNILQEDESIETKSIKEWKKNTPQLLKIPCLFLLGT